ncbi:MAG: methylated-DNA--[protein]-cysteine S-methyltransferase [Muribaculaceae bacterium]|nr:methylated-DNA--[protein]-cysteine S-methyltransferase [Muribaculaceae bacterium]
MYENIYNSPIGEICLIAQDDCLIYCNWVADECNRKYERIITLFDSPVKNSEIKVVEVAKCQLEGYFRGEISKFSVPLTYSGTEFQKNVWKILRGIGYGETLSYKELARLVGKENGMRAVAQACGANPLAIIVPCHRVIGKDRKLGGYTGGLDKKRALLLIEGIKI